jgi:hypothetical protein
MTTTEVVTEEHKRIAAMATQGMGFDVPAEFVAKSERLTGIPFLQMTVEDLERANELAQLECNAALAAIDAEAAFQGQLLVDAGRISQEEYDAWVASWTYP